MIRLLIAAISFLSAPAIALAGFSIIQVGGAGGGAGTPAVVWTLPAPTGTSCGTGNNSCIIYVDNTGGQGNDGTCAVQSPPITNTPTAGVPCATIAKAMTLIRAGKPDYVLLKNGDTFTNDKFGSITASGLSSSQPIVLGAYGASSTQPIVQLSSANTPCMSQHAAGQADNIFVTGITFYAFTRDPNNGSFSLADATSFEECFTWQGVSTTSFTSLVFENVHTSFFSLAFDIDSNGGAEPGMFCHGCNVTINGSVVTDDYPSSFNTHSQGAFLSGIGDASSLTFNTFDGNGFNAQLVGPYTATMTCTTPAVFTVTASPFPFKNGSFVSLAGTPCTGFNTSTYYCAINVSGNTFNVTANSGSGNLCPNGTTTLNGTGSSSGLTVKANDFGSQIFNRNLYTNASFITALNNIFSNSSAEGVQFRSGGGPFTNNLFYNDSLCWSIGDDITGTVTGTSSNNVCMNSVSIAQGTATPTALARGDGTQVQDGTTGLVYTGNLFAHSSSGSSSNAGAIWLTPTTSGAVATGNVICWPSIINDQGTGDTTSPNQTSTNASCSGLGFSDPTRTVATYDSTILGGPGTLADFTICARANSKASWNANCTAANVNAWIRPGYNMTPFLLRRDIDPGANDNTPMWLNEAA